VICCMEIMRSKGYRETEKKLQELFENIMTGPKRGAFFPTPYEAFRKHCKDFYLKWKETQNVSRILRYLKTRVSYPDKRIESMSKMLAYMGLIESLGVILIDMVLILLIANKREVHTRRPFIKHVATFDELANLDLKDKLDFLGTEGIHLFNEFINRDVRNDIAHLKFSISDSGEIQKRTRRGPKSINIDDEISKFWEGVDAIENIFKEIGLLGFVESKCQ